MAAVTDVNYALTPDQHARELRRAVVAATVGTTIEWYDFLLYSTMAGLVFGKAVQDSLGIWAYFVGTGIHFVFATGWGILFAMIWPYFRRRGYEATFVALFYAMFAWIVMHVAIMIAGDNHPNYYDPVVIIGGFMSHFFFTVTLALIVKKQLAPQAVS